MTCKHEYKIISKHLMAVKEGSAWRIRDNIFETVKAFLLWNYSNEWLPMFPPSYENYDQLEDWYHALSKPNSPSKRVLKVSDEEYRSWMQSLDLSKPLDRVTCDKMFEIVSSNTKREVDEIAIAENENNHDL